MDSCSGTLDQLPAREQHPVAESAHAARKFAQEIFKEPQPGSVVAELALLLGGGLGLGLRPGELLLVPLRKQFVVLPERLV